MSSTPNVFNARPWLDKRLPPVAAEPGALYNYPPGSPALPGYRLCLILGTLRNRRQLTDEGARTYYGHNVRLCTNE